jgi:23S rRNA (cytidine2498-2'-O)-methyltransferase
MVPPASNQRTAYLAFEGFEKELSEELSHIEAQHQRLFITEGPALPVIWAQDIWPDAQIIDIQSIGDAVKRLKSQGPLWASYTFDWHRRAALIQEQLPKVRNSPIDFMQPLKSRSLGSWTLLATDRLLFSARSRSLFPRGEIQFNENKEIPPSRAYLKLWELFTIHGFVPSRGQRVIDLGSSPGGWTWVLQQVGCKVVSVDKAELDEKIKKLPGIESLKKDAFKLSPDDVGPVDWLFSDIICYPEKLLEYLEPWIQRPISLVCTLKFKGNIELKVIKEFLKVPGSQILHLYHNKHEVTWVRPHTKK